MAKVEVDIPKGLVEKAAGTKLKQLNKELVKAHNKIAKLEREIYSYKVGAEAVKQAQQAFEDLRYFLKDKFNLHEWNDGNQYY